MTSMSTASLPPLPPSASSTPTTLTGLIRAKRWQEALERADVSGSCVSRRNAEMDNDGSGADEESPLHVALRRGMDTPVEVIEALVKAYPDDANRMAHNNTGSLPLHEACFLGVQTDVLRVLLHANPTAASVRNKLGMLPLHRAVHSGGTKHVRSDTIRLLLNADPTAASAVTDPLRGNALALHLICCFPRDVDVDAVMALVLAYPESVVMIDCCGRIPLDFVMEKFGRRNVQMSVDSFHEFSTEEEEEEHDMNGNGTCRRMVDDVSSTADVDDDGGVDHLEALLGRMGIDNLVPWVQIAELLLRAMLYQDMYGVEGGRSRKKKGRETETTTTMTADDEQEPVPSLEHFLRDDTRWAFHAIAHGACHVDPYFWKLTKLRYYYYASSMDDSSSRSGRRASPVGGAGGPRRHRRYFQCDFHGRTPLHYIAACASCQRYGPSDMECESHCRLCSWSYAGRRRRRPSSGGRIRDGGARRMRGHVISHGSSNDNGGGVVVDARPSSSPFETIYHDLLRFDPEAANMEDTDGKVPLTLALENGCHVLSWGEEGSHGGITTSSATATATATTSAEDTGGDGCGIMDTLMKHTSATMLDVPDRTTGLLPFMTAAAAAAAVVVDDDRDMDEEDAAMTPEADLETLTVIFELLRHHVPVHSFEEGAAAAAARRQQQQRGSSASSVLSSLSLRRSISGLGRWMKRQSSSFWETTSSKAILLDLSDVAIEL